MDNNKVASGLDQSKVESKSSLQKKKLLKLLKEKKAKEAEANNADKNDNEQIDSAEEDNDNNAFNEQAMNAFLTKTSTKTNNNLKKKENCDYRKW